MEKRDELYRGKAKTVYFTDDSDKLILHFRNDTSAFDGEKIEQLDRKGEVNNTVKLHKTDVDGESVSKHFVKMINGEDK